MTCALISRFRRESYRRYLRLWTLQLACVLGLAAVGIEVFNFIVGRLLK